MYGVQGVTALMGSNLMGVVGEREPSGADLSLSNSVANQV
jgi:hypothetical protein